MFVEGRDVVGLFADVPNEVVGAEVGVEEGAEVGDLGGGGEGHVVDSGDDFDDVLDTFFRMELLVDGFGNIVEEAFGVLGQFSYRGQLEGKEKFLIWRREGTFFFSPEKKFMLKYKNNLIFEILRTNFYFKLFFW